MNVVEELVKIVDTSLNCKMTSALDTPTGYNLHAMQVLS